MTLTIHPGHVLETLALVPSDSVKALERTVEHATKILGIKERDT